MAVVRIVCILGLVFQSPLVVPFECCGCPSQSPYASVRGEADSVDGTQACCQSADRATAETNGRLLGDTASTCNRCHESQGNAGLPPGREKGLPCVPLNCPCNCCGKIVSEPASNESTDDPARLLVMNRSLFPDASFVSLDGCSHRYVSVTDGMFSLGTFQQRLCVWLN